MTIRSIPIRNTPVSFKLYRPEESSINISVRRDNTVYGLGQYIIPTITITNTGTRTLTDITLASDMLNFNGIIVNSLSSGQSYTYTMSSYSYLVDEATILDGLIVDFSVSALDTLDDEITDSTTYTYSVESPRSTLSVVFTPDSTEYAEGDTITPEITITNTGNLTITNISVESELSGLSTSINTLSPGNSYVISGNGSYTVMEADILAGSVSYDANVSGLSPDPDYPDVIETETKSYSVVAVRKGLSINFTQDNTNYVVGDNIVPTFTITNTGNVTLNNINISCDETGDEWLKDGLAPNITSTLYTCGRYVATSSDISNGFTCTVSCEDGSGYSTEQSYTYSVGTGLYQITYPENLANQTLKVTLSNQDTITTTDNIKCRQMNLQKYNISLTADTGYNPGSLIFNGVNQNTSSKSGYKVTSNLNITATNAEYTNTSYNHKYNIYNSTSTTVPVTYTLETTNYYTGVTSTSTGSITANSGTTSLTTITLPVLSTYTLTVSVPSDSGVAVMNFENTTYTTQQTITSSKSNSITLNSKLEVPTPPTPDPPSS